MSVTLDLPPNILEQARKYAASEGVSLDAFIVKCIERASPSSLQSNDRLPTISTNEEKFGLFLGSVTYMADDFNDTPEEFAEYVE